MNTAPTATSTLAVREVDGPVWPLLPVETEIYILPDGRVIVADLPAELAPLLAALGLTAVADVDVIDEQSLAHE